MVILDEELSGLFYGLHIIDTVREVYRSQRGSCMKAKKDIQNHNLSSVKSGVVTMIRCETVCLTIDTSHCQVGKRSWALGVN